MLKSFKAKNLLCIALAVIMLCSSIFSVALAAGSAESIIGKVLGIVMDIFMYIGIVLLVWSIGMLILAFKNEDADSKTRAIMLLIVSIALIGLKPLVNGVLTVVAVNISIS